MIALWLLPLLLFQIPAKNAGIPPARKASVVCVLPIQGEMDALTVSGLAQRLVQAKNAGADAIVLQLDTPGGDLLATLELCRQIKSEYPANTVAWIRPRAYSAGVITALACREIIVAPQSVLGDAAPIAAIPVAGLISLPAAERAKLEAPLLSEVTDSSRRSGHDERLARAFVCVGDELWLVEDAERGERYVVDVNEYKIVFGNDPIRLRGSTPAPMEDASMTPPSDSESESESGSGSASESDAMTPQQSMPDGQSKNVPDAEYIGKTVDNSSSSAGQAEHNNSAAPTAPVIPFRTDALRQPANTDNDSASPIDQSQASRQPLLSGGQRNQSLLPSRALLSAADAARLKVISQIDTANELLTLQADEALALGLACATIANESELQDFFGAKKVFTISAPWSEQLARTLTSWWMRTLLVAILVLCFFGEMSAPGLGMFGFTGVACVALLAGGSYLAGLSQWWPVLSIMVGLVLIGAEILFLQGTFISGALGVLAFTGGVIGLFVVSDPTPESGTKQAFLGMASLVTSVGVAGIVAWLLGPRLQLMRPWQATVLHATLGGTSHVSIAAQPLPLPGTLACAATDLRPVGKIEIAGVRFDARSEGAWITSGTNVRILRSEGNELVVEQIT